MYKRIGLILLLLLLIPWTLASAAQSEMWDEQNDYGDQLRASGADTLPNDLPPETRALLDRLGITSLDADSILSLTPSSLWQAGKDIVADAAKAPLKTLAVVIGIILLCALLDGLKLSLGDKPLTGVFGAVASISVGIAVLIPVLETIRKGGEAIQTGANFMFAFIPVFAGIMMVAGQPASAGVYQTLLFGAAEVVASIAAGVLVPLLTLYLAFCLVGAAAPDLNLESTSKAIKNGASWILTIIMTIYVGILTIQGVVGAAADTVALKTVKFFAGSAIPVVGSVLGEAVASVQSCLGLLKSSVGGFGILAVVMIFLPPLLEALLWQAVLNVAAAFGDLFGLKHVTGILRGTSGALSVLVAIILCCALLLIVSTALILMMGGGA